MKRLISILPILLLFYGCAPLFFEESQPNFIKEESEFKKRFLGEYFNYEDSSYIKVQDKSILISSLWFGEKRGDTLFNISKNNILKYYNKKYFLNYQDFDGHWMLQLMDLEDESISFYCLNLPEDDEEKKEIGAIVEIRNECGDIIKVVVNPTRKGLKKLMGDENLEKLTTYNRINKQN